jgi:signal peptide peptidase SppA
MWYTVEVTRRSRAREGTMKIPDIIQRGLKIGFIAVILATVAMFWYDEITYYFGGEEDLFDGGVIAECPRGANTALIRVYGDIVSYKYWADDTWRQTTAAQFVSFMSEIAENDNMRAVIIDIDSYGGEVGAGEEMYRAVRSMEKPTVAVIKGIGFSGGYMVACAADRVFATRLSEVGSIGVTGSYLDYSRVLMREGILYQRLVSGEYKDTGSPVKPLTEEERALLMRDIMKMHDIFVEMVAEARGLPIESVRALADGSTMLAEDAHSAGLIDQVGGIEEAKTYLAETYGFRPVLCEIKEPETETY